MRIEDTGSSRYLAPPMALKGNYAMNISLLYAGTVKEGGFCRRNLAMRDSLACLERSKMKFFRQPWSNIELIADKLAICGMAAQLNRPEYRVKARRLHENGGDVDASGAETRFHSEAAQAKCLDIVARGDPKEIGMDVAANNAVFTCPNKGLHTCGWCGDGIMAKTGACLARHISGNHKRLMNSEIGRAHV